MIIGHDSQKEKFCWTKEYEEKHLSHARTIGNDYPLLQCWPEIYEYKLLWKGNP